MRFYSFHKEVYNMVPNYLYFVNIIKDNNVSENLFMWIAKFIWGKVFKNGPSEIYGRQPLKFEGIWSA